MNLALEMAKIILSHGDETDGTAFPIWYVAVKGGAVQRMSGTAAVMVSDGIWFSRKAAKEHLEAKRHRYPSTAFIYCGSCHMSWEMRELYELAQKAMAEAEAEAA